MPQSERSADERGKAASKRAKKSHVPTYQHETLTLAADWSRTYHAPAPIAQIARFSRPLFQRYPFSQVQVHWRHYLAVHQNGRAVYASPARFAQTFGAWAPPTHSVVWLPSADELDARAGIPVPKGPA